MSVDGQHFTCAGINRLLQLSQLYLSELIKRVEIIK